MKYTAIIHEAEEGGYWAEVPELPGCITEGDTLDEVKAMVLDAAKCWMEAEAKYGKNYSGTIVFAPVRRLPRPRLDPAPFAAPRRRSRRMEAVLA